MPNTTVAVKQDGTGDYTTISSAVAAASLGSGYYKIEIQDSNQYSEQVTINVSSPTSSNYVWLTVADGHRHQGVAGTGHARVYHNTAGNAVIDNDTNYTRIEYLDIEHGANGGGIEANGTDPLISRCIIRGDGSSSVYGVWFQGGFGSIDNCVISNGFTHGIYVYQYSGTTAINVDHCTIIGMRTSGIHADKGPYHYSGSFTVYNTVAGDNDTYDFSSYGWPSGYAWTWNGSHNVWDTNTAGIYTTNNLTNSQNISSGGVTTTTTTANAYICTNTSSGSEDFTPVEATGSGSNLALLNGTNRQGSEPDSRQDFSKDIRGKARPTGAGEIDIGAFQISGGPVLKYWNGSNFVDATAVQYYNGSAWVDVTGIQYWNGSTWTDVS